jgi:nucleotide-binding universal stress UspA family protein
MALQVRSQIHAEEQAMTIRVILAPVLGDENDQVGLATALTVARSFEAHVRVLHVRAQPSAALFASGYDGAFAAAEVISMLEREAAERARRARAAYDAWRDAAGLVETATPSGGGGASTSWVAIDGIVAPTIARFGRVADLIVLGAAPKDSDEALAFSVEGALFDSRRPVLMIRGSAVPAALGTAMIGWNGSAEAAAAIAGALPFLKRAKRIHVFAAAERGEDPQLPTELIDYLAWHGISATVRTVTASPANVGGELLREAELVGAELVIMGAYTHGRLRQLIFGGATSHVLRHTTIPMLMAH